MLNKIKEVFENVFGGIEIGVQSEYKVSFAVALRNALRCKVESYLLEDTDIVQVNHLGTTYYIVIAQCSNLEDDEYEAIFATETCITTTKFTSISDVAQVLIEGRPISDLGVKRTLPLDGTRSALNIVAKSDKVVPATISKPNTEIEVKATTEPEVKVSDTTPENSNEPQQQEVQFTQIPQLDEKVKNRENEADNVFVQAAAKKFQRELNEFEAKKQHEEFMRQQYEYQMEMQRQQAMAYLQRAEMNQNTLPLAPVVHNDVLLGLRPTLAYQEYNINNPFFDMMPDFNDQIPLPPHQPIMPPNHDWCNDDIFAIQ